MPISSSQNIDNPDYIFEQIRFWRYTLGAGKNLGQSEEAISIVIALITEFENRHKT